MIAQALFESDIIKENYMIYEHRTRVVCLRLHEGLLVYSVLFYWR
jgi:hypothetical protein